MNISRVNIICLLIVSAFILSGCVGLRNPVYFPGPDDLPNNATDARKKFRLASENQNHMPVIDRHKHQYALNWDDQCNDLEEEFTHLKEKIVMYNHAMDYWWRTNLIGLAEEVTIACSIGNECWSGYIGFDAVLLGVFIPYNNKMNVKNAQFYKVFQDRIDFLDKCIKSL